MAVTLAANQRAVVLDRASRRAIARVQASNARVRLLEAAKRLDGDLPTAHHNALLAVTAAQDLIDAIDSIEADRNAELARFAHDDRLAKASFEEEGR